MMQRGCVIMTSKLQSLLRDVLGSVNGTEYVPYYEHEHGIATRLLTNRPMWYYSIENIFGTYHNGNFITGAKPRDYTNLALDHMDDYLHPDEAVLSSFMGLYVPSIAYTDGKWSNVCLCDAQHAKGIEVTMLAQATPRLDNATVGGEGYLLGSGDGYTIFEQVVIRFLRRIDKDLYKARAQVIFDQTFHCVFSKLKAKSVNLVISGPPEWAHVPNINLHARHIAGLTAALTLYEPKPTPTNLKRITLMGLTASEDLKQACKSRGIEIIHKRSDDAPFDLQSKLHIVYSFPRNSMSLLGNKYFLGKGSAEGLGEEAAACSTSVAVLSHPLINPEMYKRFTPV